jgi:hypothetical protein
LHFEASVNEGKVLVTDSKGNRIAANGLYLYVLGKDGKFYLIKSRLDGKPYYHSSIYGGEEIKAAGELKARDGIIKSMNYQSGHYKPLKGSILLVLNFLILQGYQYRDFSTQVIDKPLW